MPYAFGEGLGKGCSTGHWVKMTVLALACKLVNQIVNEGDPLRLYQEGAALSSTGSQREEEDSVDCL